uniref:Protein LTV1 n=1 Tax=Anthurium amnicola TaxID=1678845 RepID=A0A1D1Y8K8_9ARAE
MGKKKKFIDKRNSAVFHLLARDESARDPAACAANSVLVRVDNNPHYAAPVSFAEEGGIYDHGSHCQNLDGDELDPYSVFADAPEDTDDGDGPRVRSGGAPLPDHVRREIIEFGLPDDGYNYLLHLREIRNSGGGSNYYQNRKARLDRLPLDVRAYDASRLRVSSEVDGGGRDPMYDVAAKTVGVKVDKVVDPDVVRLLDDSDLSRFESDVEDLEEDFVVRANCVQGGEEEGSFSHNSSNGRVIVPPFQNDAFGDDESSREQELGLGSWNEFRNCDRDGQGELAGSERQRSRRPLDEQFDQLMVNEYGDDSDSDDACYIENKGEESLAAEIKHALKEYSENDFELEENYKVPADFLRQGQVTTSIQLAESSADIMRRCAEYAQMYSQEDQDDEVVVFEESSDESEVWDCETIVSTYSNLDNHPGRIQAPDKPKSKPQLAETIPVFPSENKKIIVLRGKEKLPVDFLPQSRRTPVEKVKKSEISGLGQQKRRAHESKEEKSERKAAVREARREARQAKKELKGLYKCETQLAQKVAAIARPSSIHLM